jgi:iron complex outermembrane receptor protein
VHIIEGKSMLFTMKTALFSSVAAASLLGSGSVLADTAAADDAGAAPTAKAENQLEEIIVTAQRRAEPLERTPIAETALTAASLENQFVLSQRDLQRTVPGLLVRATSSDQDISFSLRGQNVEAFTSSPPAVQTYFNEVPLASSGNASFYDLASVEVLKGPQGTLFGRNSTGGAVLERSVQPEPQFGGYVTLRGGDYGVRNAEGAINLPLVGERVILRVAGNVKEHDGYVFNDYTGKPYGDGHEGAVRATLLVAPGAGFKNTLTVDYSHAAGESTPSELWSVYPLGSTNNGVKLNSTVAALFTPFLDTAVGAPGAWAAYLALHPHADPGGITQSLAIQQQTGPWTTNMGMNATYKNHNLVVSNISSYDLTDTLHLKNIVGYNNIANEQSFPGSGGPYLTIQSNHAYPQKTWSDEAQLLGEAFGPALKYVTGFYYFHDSHQFLQHDENVDLTPIIKPRLNPLRDEETTNSYAAYAEGTLNLATLTGLNGLSFTAGTRYTVEDTTMDQLVGSKFYGAPLLSGVTHKLSWHFGLEEQLNDAVLLYVTSRHSFRSGGFNLSATPAPGTAAAGGALFLPEVATDVEIGSKYRGEVAQMPATLNVALYNTWIDNVQRSDFVNIDGSAAALTINVPKSKVQGVELDAQIRPLSWLSLGGQTAYTYAVFTQNVTEVFGQTTIFGPYPNTPRWTGSAFVQGQVPLGHDIGDLLLRADYFVQTQFYFSSLNNTVTPGTDIPGYHLLNLRAALQNVGGKGLDLAVTVTNVTNERYYLGGIAVGNVLGVNSVIPGAPRMFVAEASYHF